MPTKTTPKPEGNKIKIIKSDNDVKTQKYVVLPNNMKCLIISDPKTDKSAASIELMVGSLNDTEEFKGTAKFLQGMLLKGSAKYPSYDNYEEFLQKNGGDWNAFTTITTTNYHFEVNNDSFDEGLDRFTQCFIDPIFDKSHIEKNIKTNHHHMKVALCNDFWHHTNLY